MLIEAAASPLFLPAGLVGLLLAVCMFTCLVSCSARRGLETAIYYIFEYGDLLTSLAVFVLLPPQISALLVRMEFDGRTGIVGLAHLNHSAPRCERGCVMQHCNTSACGGCGMCQSSEHSCQSFDIEFRCQIGNANVIVDCPGTSTVSGGLLPTYIGHALLAAGGVVHVVSSLQANRQPIRSYGFYAFAALRRHGKWFQRYVKLLVMVLTIELIATLLLASFITEDAHASASRAFEVACVICAILADLASQLDPGDRPRGVPRCHVPLAVPLRRRAHAVLASVDRAYLLWQLRGDMEPLKKLLGGPTKDKGRALEDLRSAIEEQLPMPPNKVRSARPGSPARALSDNIVTLTRQLSGKAKLPADRDCKSQEAVALNMSTGLGSTQLTTLASGTLASSQI
jgi:hypothetical protein